MKHNARSGSDGCREGKQNSTRAECAVTSASGQMGATRLHVPAWAHSPCTYTPMHLVTRACSPAASPKGWPQVASIEEHLCPGLSMDLPGPLAQGPVNPGSTEKGLCNWSFFPFIYAFYSEGTETEMYHLLGYSTNPYSNQRLAKPGASPGTPSLPCCGAGSRIAEPLLAASHDAQEQKAEWEVTQGSSTVALWLKSLP